jgi:chromate reductase
MVTIMGISGSLRAQSYNTALLRAAKQQVGANVTFELATLHGIPLYDGDLEQQAGLPQAVVDLIDEAVQKNLCDFMQGFVQFVGS